MERQGDVYSLTHDDSRLPGHYGWQNDSQLESIKNAFRAKGIVEEPGEQRSVEEIVSSLDDQGRWITRYNGEPLVGQPKFKEGEEYISSHVFSDNLEILSRYLTK